MLQGNQMVKKSEAFEEDEEAWASRHSVDPSSRYRGMHVVAWVVLGVLVVSIDTVRQVASCAFRLLFPLELPVTSRACWKGLSWRGRWQRAKE
jgi:hypothetical protein